MNLSLTSPGTGVLSPSSGRHLRRLRPCSLALVLVAMAIRLAAQEAPAHLTLDDAIRLALANNQSLKVDALSRAAAKADLLIHLVGRRPL